MRKSLVALTLISGIALAGCTTSQGALVGGATGAAIGGLATDSVGGAIVGAGVGALAGAILVESSKGWCTYRYNGRTYRERC
jgi:surface antigen